MHCTWRLVGVRTNSQLTSSGYKTIRGKDELEEKNDQRFNFRKCIFKIKKKKVKKTHNCINSGFSVTFLSNVA